MKKIQKILVANRGEIALRVMRTAREMGISTVAVYSDVDNTAPFVRFADEAYCLGNAVASESYLNVRKILDAIKKSGADAVHPGYGFLSENADFAEKVEKSGVIFIGPSSYSMRIMGDKLTAKAAVGKYDIRMVPGSPGEIKDVKLAKKIADKIGYPVLIKASAGGGGKGMRIVESADELEPKMKMAMSEAQSAFGNNAVFIEKFIRSPRHIEFQILADSHDNIVHLFERECSIQRRHQKVIEEAPATRMSAELREQMGRCAVDVARSCKYTGAGTVEFLVDDKNDFYFLEMNTRLQVEHPVTEMITGKDLVREQIKVAQGEKLSFNQSQLSINGHAIELRVYAEDPDNNFLPSTGKLKKYKPPYGRGVRVDDGYAEGLEVSVYYDPMISKLVAHGSNRIFAMETLKRAIDEYEIVGVKNTLGFGKFALNNKMFISGNYNTNFVSEHYLDQKSPRRNKDEAFAAAVLGFLAQDQIDKQNSQYPKSRNNQTAWLKNRKKFNF